jgi:hypothetical protein
MAINRASISKELLPGLNAVFGMEYGEVKKKYSSLVSVLHPLRVKVLLFLMMTHRKAIQPVIRLRR